MTKSAHTTTPPDAAAHRRAPPVLTYSVGQLPMFDPAFYDKARAELSKGWALDIFDRASGSHDSPTVVVQRLGQRVRFAPASRPCQI